MNIYRGFCSEESPDIKCCVDSSYDPNFRYASNEAAPSDWMVGLGMEQPNGQDWVVGTTAPPTGPTTTTTKDPIKKSGSGPFDSNDGYSRSNPGDVMNSNGQCECKSLEKSI